MKLLVGLGNPWQQYKKTKHNVGFIVLKNICEKIGLGEMRYKNKYKAVICDGKYKGEKIIAIQPQTFMNRSGESLAIVKNFYNISADNIIVLQDDLDLEFGQIKRKKWGSAGGHNGIKSINKKIGTQDFWRIKIGIGRPDNPHIFISDYVLSRLSENELAKINQVNQNILSRIDQIIQEK